MNRNMPNGPRRLPWPACYNARDLGGLPTHDGAVIRRAALIRSDILARLTPEGERALLEYGVRTVIDLRAPGEATREPYSLMQAGSLVYHNPPLIDPDSPAMAEVRRARTREEDYCLTLEHFKPQVAAILRTVAHAEEGGVLVHCHAGKDRTGIVVALLLAVAGVHHAEIAADYAASEACLWPLYDKQVAEAGDDPDKLAQLPPPPGASPDTMLALLAYLERQYGGVQEYLLATGLSQSELEQVRERLRTTTSVQGN